MEPLRTRKYNSTTHFAVSFPACRRTAGTAPRSATARCQPIRTTDHNRAPIDRRERNCRWSRRAAGPGNRRSCDVSSHCATALERGTDRRGDWLLDPRSVPVGDSALAETSRTLRRSRPCSERPPQIAAAGAGAPFAQSRSRSGPAGLHPPPALSLDTRVQTAPSPGRRN